MLARFLNDDKPPKKPFWRKQPTDNNTVSVNYTPATK